MFAERGFVGSDLVASRASDGAVLWRRDFFAGADVPVTVDAERVYRTDCASVEALDAGDGDPAWRHFSGEDCRSFIGEPAGVIGGRLFVPNFGLGARDMAVYERSGTGPVARLSSDDMLPVAAAGVIVTVEGGRLTGRAPDGGLRWRLDRGLRFAVPPLAGRGRVYAAARDGLVVIVEPRLGRVLWRGRSGAGQVGGLPLNWSLKTGLGADARVLVVPGARRLVAFARSRPRGRAGAAPRGRRVRSPAPAAATNFQLDATHRGWSPAGLTPPLRLASSHPIGVEPSYPIIADGRVFIASTDRATGTVAALRAADGTPVWSQPLPEGADWFGLAHGRDTLRVASNSAGGTRFTAYDAARGTQLWSLLRTGRLESVPAASGGLAYVTYGGVAEALDLRTGATRWLTPALGFSSSPGTPAVTGERVIVADACRGAVALRRDDGAPLWRAESKCSAGNFGPAPIVAGRRVAFSEVAATVVRDRRTGSVVDAGGGGPPPAIGPRIAVSAANDELSAADSRTGLGLWSVRAGPTLNMPLLLGRHAWATETSSSRLLAFDTRSGRRVWSRRLPSAPVAWHEIGQPTGMAAAQGLLVVPTAGWLLAFRAPRRYDRRS